MCDRCGVYLFIQYVKLIETVDGGEEESESEEEEEEHESDQVNCDATPQNEVDHPGKWNSPNASIIAWGATPSPSSLLYYHHFTVLSFRGENLLQRNQEV